VGAENNGWFDSTRNRRNNAYDDHGHGTHCTGSVLGANGMGVAPGAKWMACKGLGGSGGGGGDMNRCQQWSICPTKQDGSGRDCSKAPHIVSNSWGGGGNFERSIAAWRRAGIIPIFAAGNSGNDCETMGYPGSSPSVIAVGATDSNDRLASFSSVGPGQNGEEQKPEVSAPGVQVRSASHRSDTGTATMSGTSMACPHVAGLVALMMSKNPELNFDDIKDALQKGVVTQGLRGPGEECGGKSANEFPNYHFGYGRSDAPLTMQQF
jgi:subtilisin family serine protease